MAKAKQPVAEHQWLKFLALAAQQMGNSTAGMEPSPQADALTREVQVWLKSNRVECTESERLAAVKAHLREHAIDFETLLHYAAAGLLASDAVLVQTERVFEFARLQADLTAAKLVSVRSTRGVENRGKGPSRAFTDEELLGERQKYIARHKGDERGWMKAAALKFERSDSYISRRYKKISEPT